MSKLKAEGRGTQGWDDIQNGTLAPELQNFNHRKHPIRQS